MVYYNSWARDGWWPEASVHTHSVLNSIHHASSKVDHQSNIYDISSTLKTFSVLLKKKLAFFAFFSSISLWFVMSDLTVSSIDSMFNVLALSRTVLMRSCNKTFTLFDEFPQRLLHSGRFYSPARMNGEKSRTIICGEKQKKKSLTSINRIVILDVYVIKELSLSRNGSICTRFFWLLITFLFIKMLSRERGWPYHSGGIVCSSFGSDVLVFSRILASQCCVVFHSVASIKI